MLDNFPAYMYHSGLDMYKERPRMSIKAERAKWLEKKGLKIRQFAEKTGQKFGTAFKWQTSGRTPRRLYLDAVLAVFPDWPHKA